MMLGENPGVPRDKSAEVYAMAKVQNASRRYMRVPLDKILSHLSALCETRKFQRLTLRCKNFAPSAIQEVGVPG
jgi:hypothetical protein